MTEHLVQTLYKFTDHYCIPQGGLGSIQFTGTARLLFPVPNTTPGTYLFTVVTSNNPKIDIDLIFMATLSN